MHIIGVRVGRTLHAIGAIVAAVVMAVEVQCLN
jgi:hypothetical protein